MNIDKYKKCCEMYARFLINDDKTPALEKTANEAFLEAYSLCLNEGINEQVLKNLFSSTLSAIRQESNKLD